MFDKLFSIEGKVAVVTGGSRGIGEMIAAGFLANGVKVYISSRKAEVCDETARRLSEQFGGECVSLPANLAELDGIQAFADELARREEQVDILVNNAGVSWGAPLDEFPEIGWDKVMDINVKAPFFLTQKFLPLLRAAASEEDPARVLMVASIDGLHVNPIETYPYAASKAGLIHLTRSLTARLSREDITVNAIAPGPFESRMMAHTLDTMGEQIRASNPRKRIGTSEDMAGVALYLASLPGTGFCALWWLDAVRHLLRHARTFGVFVRRSGFRERMVGLRVELLEDLQTMADRYLELREAGELAGRPAAVTGGAP